MTGIMEKPFQSLPIRAASEGKAPSGLLPNAFLVLLFFVIALVVNYAGLHAPMNYDSAAWLERQRHTFAFGSLLDVIRIFPQRPVVMTTFYANFVVGDMNPVYFRLFNIFVLSCTSVLVVFLVQLLVRVSHTGQDEDSSQPRFLGILFGLLFLVHPFQTTVTLYIWQRSALLACFFYYASLFSYLTARTVRNRNPFPAYVACIALFVCALLSKENSVTLPIMVVLADAVLFRDRWRTLVQRSAAYVAVTGTCVALLSLVNRAHGNMTYSPGISGALGRNYEESGLTLVQVLVTQARVLFTYMEAIVFPAASSVQLTSPQRISSSPFSLPDLVATIAAVAAIGVSMYLLRKRPLAGFGAVFFLVNLIPEGFLVPQYQYFGYRAVLPLLGAALVGADCMLAVARLARSASTRAYLKGAMAVCAAVAILGFARISYLKAALWADPVRYWKDTVARVPKYDTTLEKLAYSQAYHNLGISLQTRGHYQEALPAFQEASRADPQQVRTLAALGSTYAELGRLPEAEEALKKVLALDPNFTLAYRHLGDLLARQGKFEEAFRQFREGLALAPSNDDLHDAMGRALFSQGNSGLAVDHLKRAVELNPASYVSHSNLAAVLLSQGQTEQALKHLERSLSLRPDYWRVHENLGMAHALEGRLEKAVSHFKEAVRLNPRDPHARENLETALKHLSETNK